MTEQSDRPHRGALARKRGASAVAAGVRMVMRLEGWTRRGVLFAMGVASTASVAPYFFSPVMLVTLPLLALMLEHPDGGAARWTARDFIRAGATGWWFGFGYFVAGLHWIIEPFLVEADLFAWLIPFAITLLPGGLALFHGFATALARAIWAPTWAPGWMAALPLAASFGLAEWLRGAVLTGFPWNPLGHALTGNSVTLQWASVLGTHALTVITVLLFCLPVLVLVDLATRRISPRQAATLGGVACLVIAVGLVYAWLHLDAPAGTQPGMKLRLVQPAIPQTEKWKPGNQRPIFDRLLELSRNGPSPAGDTASPDTDTLKGITHMIWPEVAMPFLPLRTPEALRKIAELVPDDAVLLTGALRINAAGNSASGERETFNSLMAFDTDGRRIASYDKQHLVPFGEYLPLQGILESIGLQQLTRLRGGFTAGTGQRKLVLPGTPAFVPLICYEVIFSGHVVPAEARPSWMLVVTNDAWFGNGAGPRQHFHQARVRAVEEGLPLVRVSNNGISAVIAPNGHLVQSLGLNARGAIDSELPLPYPPTVFSRFGDAWFWVLVCIFAGVGPLQHRYKRVPSDVSQP